MTHIEGALTHKDAHACVYVCAQSFAERNPYASLIMGARLHGRGRQNRPSGRDSRTSEQFRVRS